MFCFLKAIRKMKKNKTKKNPKNIVARLRTRRCFLGATSSPCLPSHLCVFFSHPFTSSKSLVPRENSPLATDLVSPLPAICKTRRQEGKKAAQMQTNAERALNKPAWFLEQILIYKSPPTQTLQISLTSRYPAHLAFADITA